MMNTQWGRLAAWLNRLVDVLDPPTPLELMETRVRRLEAQLAARAATKVESR